jgi:long-chain acyl-CoA synthetase
MKFWELDHPGDRPALIDADLGQTWSYGDLMRAASRVALRLGPPKRKQLGFILCRNTPECVAAYIGSLQANSVPALFSADLPEALLLPLIQAYRPDWVFAGSSSQCLHGYTLTETMAGFGLWHLRQAERDIHEDLGLLLSTSGSTGTPKLVRLSHANLQANAESICRYLEIDEHEKPITALPMAYSYGLSVINSHLLAGATILLSNKSVLQREFWDCVVKNNATSFSGVPYTYQMLVRTGLMQKDCPVRTWTQAGGRLDPKYLQRVHEIAVAKSQRLFVMYGQTEATARISYVPHDQLAAHIGSIGVAIPGGRLRMVPEDGELVYSGPNVMMGYAADVHDLGKGDELNGELHTGDLARMEEGGFFHITGRKKRFLKLLGLRLSLDDVETTLVKNFDSAIACFGTDELLQIAVEDETLIQRITILCSEVFKLHHSVIRVMHVDHLPLTANGKTDYCALDQDSKPAAKCFAAGQ